MGKLIQALGKAGEERAWWFFNQIGAKCVEKISTPMKTIKGKAIFYDKSSVDFIAKIPYKLYDTEFTASRIEVKYRSSDRLNYSDLEEHQIKWLSEWSDHTLWNKNSFYSFILWIRSDMSCYLIPFPNDYFKPGESLTIELAKKLSWFNSEDK